MLGPLLDAEQLKLRRTVRHKFDSLHKTGPNCVTLTAGDLRRQRQKEFVYSFRAKRTLADKHIPFKVPRGPELAARLSSVVEVIYLIFNEGYSATTGDDLMRPTLCEDALRLGHILAELTPSEPEVHGRRSSAVRILYAAVTRAPVG
jgi:hypothetical protein